MSSERAGAPTHGALNRDAVQDVLNDYYHGDLPAENALDALEACVVPDPRIQRIEALPVYRRTPNALGWISADAVEKILRGDE